MNLEFPLSSQTAAPEGGRQVWLPLTPQSVIWRRAQVRGGGKLWSFRPGLCPRNSWALARSWSGEGSYLAKAQCSRPPVYVLELHAAWVGRLQRKQRRQARPAGVGSDAHQSRRASALSHLQHPLSQPGAGPGAFIQLSTACMFEGLLNTESRIGQGEGDGQNRDPASVPSPPAQRTWQKTDSTACAGVLGGVSRQ